MLVGLTLTLLLLGCGPSKPANPSANDGTAVEMDANLSKNVYPAPKADQPDIEDYAIVLALINNGDAPVSVTKLSAVLTNPTTGVNYSGSLIAHGGPLQKGAVPPAGTGEFTIKPQAKVNRAIDLTGVTGEMMKGLRPGGFLQCRVTMATKAGGKDRVYESDLPPLDQLPVSERDGAMKVRLVVPGEKSKAPKEGEGEGEGGGGD
jgi:hypothetical protein